MGKKLALMLLFSAVCVVSVLAAETKHIYKWVSANEYKYAEIQTWLTQLKNPAAPERRRAAFNLGKVKAAEAVGPLLELLDDENNDVCGATAIALGRIADKRALEPLIERLEDESPYVRASAAKALGYLGDKSAVAPLKTVMKDENEAVRKAAAEALKKLANVEGKAEAEAKKEKLDRVKMREVFPIVTYTQTASDVAKSGDVKDAVPALTEAQQDKNDFAGMRAAAALDKIGEVGSKQRSVVGGITRINSRWSQGWAFMGSKNSDLEYIFKRGPFTKLDGFFLQKKLGLSFGANINIEDNDIKKVSRVLGWIGYKKSRLRIQVGNIKGAVDWNGSLSPGQSRRSEFEKSFTQTDLLFGNPFMYFGLGYTSFGLPVEVKPTWDESWEGTPNHFLDPDFKATFFCFVWGADPAAGYVGEEWELPDPLFGLGGHGKPYFVGLDVGMDSRLGFGKGKISGEGVRNFLASNPSLPYASTPARENIEDSFYMSLLEMDLNMGVFCGFTIGPARAVVSLGYDMALIWSSNIEPGVSRSNPGLRMDPYTRLFRTGPAIKFRLAW